VKVTKEKIPESQIVLTIEVPQERLEGALDSAYRKLARRARIPGFRPGKAPRALIERHYGREALIDEALDALVPEVYREALERDEEIEPIAMPRLVVETVEPLVVKATIPVKPTVELGDFRSVRVERPRVEVDPERIDRTLEDLRRRYATLEPVERPVQWGDVVRADVRAEAGERMLFEEEDAEFKLTEGRIVSLPGFAERMIGAAKGAVLEFDLTVPEDLRDKRIAGKPCHYTVTVKEVKEEVLPELNDDFAREVGEGFPSLRALRERIEADIKEGEEARAEREYQDRIIDEILKQATIEYPSVLLDREMDRLIRDHLGPDTDRADFRRYLERIGKTEEEFLAELRPVADDRVRRSLVLTAVAEAEHLDVTDAEVDAEIERLVASSGVEAAQMRQVFDTEGGRRSLRNSLLTRKTLDRLVAIASGQAEPAAAGAETESGT
jgi:trigger factor